MVESGAVRAGGTDASAIFMWTLIPLTVAAGFVWFGRDPADADDWVRGLLVLIPLEYFRVFVLSILSETYREYRTPAQAVGVFLISLAILTAIALAISVWVLKGDWWSWISQPDVWHAIAFALGLIAVDGVIGVFFFRGDAKVLSVRLEAAADDARDWLQIGGFQLPIALALLYGVMLIARESGHGFAWVPDLPSYEMRSVGLFYAAFYFFGKAVLLAYVNTSRFNASGNRLLGARWIQALIWEKNKDLARSASEERAAALRRRAVLAGAART